jgi:hypothetical protein
MQPKSTYPDDLLVASLRATLSRNQSERAFTCDSPWLDRSSPSTLLECHFAPFSEFRVPGHEGPHSGLYVRIKKMLPSGVVASPEMLPARRHARDIPREAGRIRHLERPIPNPSLCRGEGAS